MTDGSDDEDRAALDGAIGPTFFRYLIPSLAGLIAMTSASLVDGIFIGNYVGVTALAAVNLIIPITALVFGIAMMLSVGGSVRAGKYLGENNVTAASAIFSKTLLSVAIYGVIVIVLSLTWEEALFAGLGATEALFPVMHDYYIVIMPFLFAQLIVVVLYFFVRLDGMLPRKIGYGDAGLMFLENLDDLLVFESVSLHFGTSQGLLYREIPSRSWLSYWGQGHNKDF